MLKIMKGGIIVKGAIELMMKDLAGSANDITGCHELLHDCLSGGNRASPIAHVTIDARRGGTQTGQGRCT